MKKIYIVTGGSYSDYSIYAVFDTEEMAQEYINLAKIANNYDFHRIETWEVNVIEKELKNKKKPFRVTFEINGDAKVNKTTPDIKHGDFTCYILLNIDIWARDEAHAIKSASDLRRIGLAKNKFSVTKYSYQKSNKNYTDCNILK